MSAVKAIEKMTLLQYLIQGKFFSPIVLFLPFWLKLFIEQQIPDHQVIHIGSHKATI